MESQPPVASDSAATPTKPNPLLRWTGRVATALMVLLMGSGALLNAIKHESVVEQSKEIGFTPTQLQFVGIVLLVSLVLYVIPRTAVLGAILLTGYFGGAILFHLHQKDPAGWMIPGFVAGVITWLVLCAREPRLFWIVVARRL